MGQRIQNEMVAVASHVARPPYARLLKDLVARQQPSGWFFASPKSLKEREVIAELERLGVITIDEGRFSTETSGRVKVSELIGRITPLGQGVAEIIGKG